ncbi:MAG: hypothetical protein JWP91_3772 [Fibrobacteres bacterium]|nr:hypothetical protein [Fibrobacterota bacterium]
MYLAPLAAFLWFLMAFRSPAYAACGLIALGTCYLLMARWNMPGSRPWGAVALVAVGLGLPALGLWQFLQFADVGDQDHSVYACMLWNLRNGNLHYSFRGMNMFGIHSQYTSILWIPLHWIAGETGLKVGKGLCLVAAAFLAVRRMQRNPDAACWGAAAILMSPAIASQFFFGFHPEFIAAPVLVLALEAYRDLKLGRFMACVFFLAFSKEAYTMAVGGILLLALVERRNWKWILLPGLMTCLQMAFYWFIIIPRFAPAGNFLGYQMPSSSGQVLAAWLRPELFLYALRVFLPFLPLMMAFPKRYMLLPLPLMVFYASFPDSSFLVMWPNYAFPLAFLCSAGLVLTPRIHIDGPERPAASSFRLDGRILVACAFTSLLCYPLWREIFSIPPDDPARVKDVARFRSAIPDSASVLINAGFASRFAARKELTVWGWRDLPLSHFDFVVLDAGYRPAWLVKDGELERGLDTLSHSPDWKLEYSRKDLYLFSRTRGLNPDSTASHAANAAPGP